MDTSEEQEDLTLTEYAAQCREVCTRPAQGHPDLPCGAAREVDGATRLSFCGFHWGPVLGSD